MTTDEQPKVVLEVDPLVKIDNLRQFLIKQMGYSEDDAKESIAREYEQIRDFAARIKDSVLADKSITPNFKKKLEEFNF